MLAVGPLFCAATAAHTQVPPQLTHQGRLNTANGSHVDGAVTFHCRRYDRGVGGEPIWAETREIPVEGGDYSVQLGDDTPLPVAAFTGSPLYLGVQIESDDEMTGRVVLSSVPYAFRAASAANATGAITPVSVSVDGRVVIDERGRRVGDSAGTDASIPADASRSAWAPCPRAGCPRRSTPRAARTAFGSAGTATSSPAAPAIRACRV